MSTAEAEALIRLDLKEMLEEEGYEVVGEAGTTAEASKLLGLLSPQVVVFDVRLPDGSGIEAAGKARAQFPDLGIVILTMYAGDEQLFEALEAGASAFVPKNAPAEDVVAAARHAAPAGAGRDLEPARLVQPDPALHRLTD